MSAIKPRQSDLSAAVETPGSAGGDAYVARQPIFNRQRQVVAYELLARAGSGNAYTHADGDLATADAMCTSLNLLGLDSMAGGTRVFVNFTRNLLLDDFASILPPKAMVVELLETVDPDNDVVEACRRLKREGYTLALDDFIERPGDAALVAMADIIKVDFMGSAPEERARLATLHAGRCELLAEKVETPEDFQEACNLGYTCFQGYFFCKPEVLKARRLDETHASRIRFLHAVSRPDVDFDELETIIKQDASLSFKLLRYLNTSVRATSRQITSIKQALTLLGERPLRRWAAMAAIASAGRDKPLELLRTCVIRARFCELLAERAGQSQHSFTMYLVGLLSVIDAILDRPLDEVLHQLAIPDRVRSTLLCDTDSLADLYHVAMAYERGDWNPVQAACERLGLTPQTITRTYADAIVWSHHLTD